MPGLEPFRELPEGLPDRPLHLVPGHSLPDLASHRKTEAGAVSTLVIAACERMDDQEAIASRAALAVDAIEIAAAG